MCREKRLRKAGGMQPKAAGNSRRRQIATGGRQDVSRQGVTKNNEA